MNGEMTCSIETLSANPDQHRVLVSLQNLRDFLHMRVQVTVQNESGTVLAESKAFELSELDLRETSMVFAKTDSPARFSVKFDVRNKETGTYSNWGTFNVEYAPSANGTSDV